MVIRTSLPAVLAALGPAALVTGGIVIAVVGGIVVYNAFRRDEVS